MARDRNPDKTRAALLEAAGRLFATKGYGHTSVDEIARAAGFSKGIIRHHFGSKRGLYEALVSDLVRQIETDAARRDLLSQPPEKALRDYVLLLGRTFGKNTHFPGLLMHEYLAGGMGGEAELIGRLKKLHDNTSRILAMGEREGLWPCTDHQAIHLQIVGPLLYFLLTRPFRESARLAGTFPAAEPDYDTFCRNVTDSIILMLRNK